MWKSELKICTLQKYRHEEQAEEDARITAAKQANKEANTCSECWQRDARKILIFFPGANKGIHRDCFSKTVRRMLLKGDLQEEYFYGWLQKERGVSIMELHNLLSSPSHDMRNEHVLYAIKRYLLSIIIVAINNSGNYDIDNIRDPPYGEFPSNATLIDYEDNSEIIKDGNDVTILDVFAEPEIFHSKRGLVENTMKRCLQKIREERERRKRRRSHSPVPETGDI